MMEKIDYAPSEKSHYRNASLQSNQNIWFTIKLNWELGHKERYETRKARTEWTILRMFKRFFRPATVCGREHFSALNQKTTTSYSLSEIEVKKDPRNYLFSTQAASNLQIKKNQ